MRNTSETDYDVIKYNHMSAQTGILNSLVTRVFLSCADHTYLRTKCMGHLYYIVSFISVT